MKNKIIGLLSCLLMLLLAVLAPLGFSGHAMEPRVHQHMGAVPESECARAGSGLCTYLPIVCIDTDGAEIPGRPIRDTQTGDKEYALAPDGQTTVAARLRIVGTDTSVYHHPEDPASLESQIRIRIRGNSSRYFEKPSYAIRLVHGDGSNNAQGVMGMPAHHEWALYGPWLDKTALRNYMFYNLAGELMDYAPNVRYCEVLVNGEYQGLYLMVETVTAGKDGARLPLEVQAKRNTFTGYLLRLDHRRSDTESIRSFCEYTHYQDPNLSLLLEYPGQKNRTEEMEEEIRQDFASFEKALYSYDYRDKTYGYPNRIDTRNFVDYFILNELTGNVDAGNYSTYLYKGVDGRLRLCVWDFNNACDNYFDDEMGYKGFFLPWRLWYTRLIKDEAFTQAIVSRYRQLRKGLLSEEAMDAYIDETLAFLQPAIRRNDARWGDVAQQAGDLLQPVTRNLTSRGAAEGQLKGYLHNRGAWLDSHIETLRHYSAPSRNKKFNEVND